MDKRKLSDKNRNTLLIGVNRDIETTVEEITEAMAKKRLNNLLSYPPNCGFTPEELKALENIKMDNDLKSALRKILAEACSRPLFSLFNYIDGTGDPGKDWTSVSFLDKELDTDEEGEFLHDKFFELYWEWRKLRPKKDWKLDTYEG